MLCFGAFVLPISAYTGAEVETKGVLPKKEERERRVASPLGRAGEAETVSLPQRRLWLRIFKVLAGRGYLRGGQSLRRILSPISFA